MMNDYTEGQISPAVSINYIIERKSNGERKHKAYS